MQQAQAPAQNPQQRGGGSNWLNSIVRLMFFYMVFNYFFKSKSAVPQVDQEGKALPVLYNIWNDGTRFELRVFLTEDANFEEHKKTDKLVWYQKDLYYDWRESNNRETFIQYKPSQELLNNGSLYAHVFVTKSGYPFDPSDPKYDTKASFYGMNSVTKYTLVKKTTKKNLLSGEINVPTNQIVNETEIRSFWKPNITLHLIEDQNRYSRSSIPPQLVEKMTINYDESYFYPTLFFDEFWLFKEHLMAINNTVDYLPLSISYNTMGLIKWQFMLQMEQSFKMQENMGTSTENDADEFKRMLVETNPYLLGLTFAVTLLHSLFDFLAFKNDIQFWKNKKSLEGLSVKTIFINAVCQFIIFLYLLDNETSWVVIISSGIGVLIEFWKIGKAVIVEVDWNKRIPITFKDRASYASKTKEFDDQAITYLSYVAYPLVIGYGIYSLMYETHKSWYSWILGSLTGCVYTFGFIMMTPQLFINYKLKSVAHLPWRTFTYKALNTFIDDLFAFIIKMPLMHRLSCFRDDIIFLIYLYQRWIYRIDYSRVNEFGQGGADDEPDNKDDKTEKTSEKEEEEETESSEEEKKEEIKEEAKEEKTEKKQKQKKSVKSKEEKKND